MAATSLITDEHIKGILYRSKMWLEYLFYSCVCNALNVSYWFVAMLALVIIWDAYYCGEWFPNLPFDAKFGFQEQLFSSMCTVQPRLNCERRDLSSVIRHQGFYRLPFPVPAKAAKTFEWDFEHIFKIYDNYSLYSAIHLFLLPMISRILIHQFCLNLMTSQGSSRGPHQCAPHGCSNGH